jgi:hypothetical protein
MNVYPGVVFLVFQSSKVMSAWSRVSRENKRLWGLIGGAILAGTVFKVGTEYGEANA